MFATLFRLRWFLLLLYGAALLLFFNTDFRDWTSLTAIQKMADAPGILAGHAQVESPFREGLRWWVGPWIQQEIQVYRPLSSILFWFECEIGLRFGFVYVAWIGVLLYGALCTLCAALTWRVTRSFLATVLGVTLATTIRFWNMGGSQPYYWLAWFPVHHDLWMIAALLGALLCFDFYLENRSRRALLGTWGCFVLGALSKEFVYIFPLLALIWATFRGVPISREVWMHITLFFTFAVAIFAFRWMVLPTPYNPPPLKKVHMIRRPFLYWFAPFYRYGLTETRWMVALAFSLFVGLKLWPRLRSWSFLARFGAILGFVALLGAQTQLLGMPVFETFWYFAEPSDLGGRALDLVAMVFLFWAVFLLWKHRKTTPALAVFGVFLCVYLPVWTYLGWHYCLAGSFVRSALWWPFLLQLVMHETNFRAHLVNLPMLRAVKVEFS